jgi:hypothetical protein
MKQLKETQAIQEEKKSAINNWKISRKTIKTDTQ